MIQSISLAQWVAAVRADLTEAITWQEEREREATARRTALVVPGLRLTELKLEVEVRTTQEVGGKAGLKFWVVTGEAERKLSNGTTQKLVLTLAPTREMHLGDEQGFLDP